MCVYVCVCVCIHTYTHTYIYLYQVNPLLVFFTDEARRFWMSQVTTCSGICTHI